MLNRTVQLAQVLGGQADEPLVAEPMTKRARALVRPRPSWSGGWRAATLCPSASPLGSAISVGRDAPASRTLQHLPARGAAPSAP